MKHESVELGAFLETENRNLREEARSLKDLLALNKQALKIAISPRENEDPLPPLVTLLFEENSKLLARCHSLQEQVENKAYQALISEQMALASNEHEKYVAEELKSRVRILKKELETKDKRIVQLQKHSGHREEYDHQDDGTVTVVEYTDVTKISEKLFKENELLRKEIEAKNQDIARLKDQKEDLVKLNLILTRQINELKAFPEKTTIRQNRDQNSSANDLTKLLKYQTKIAEHADSDSEEEDYEGSEFSENSDSSDPEEMEEEMATPVKKVDLSLNLNLKGFKGLEKKEEEKVEKGSKIVPKLELKKAKELQTMIVKKINNDEKKKQGANVKDEKYKKIETECEELRKKLGSEIILKLRFEKETMVLKKFLEELEQRNEMLLKSRREQDENAEKGQEYEREFPEDNVETILDICRDVTMNQRLRAVCKGLEQLQIKKNVESKEV